MKAARPRHGVSIAPLTLANLDRCADVVEATWPERRSRFVAEMRIYFAARAIFSPVAALARSEDRRVVGCGVTVVSPLADDVRELLWVCVHPDWRGRGIGTRIVEYLFRCVGGPMIFASPAPRFYELLGCETIYQGRATVIMARRPKR